MPLQPKQQPPYYTPAANIKIYTALLSQSGTDAPTAIILQNTLNATPTLTRTAAGTYKITLTAAFPEEKTTSYIGSGQLGVTTSNPVISTIHQDDENEFWINTYDNTFTNEDGNLQNTPIQIIVYV